MENSLEHQSSNDVMNPGMMGAVVALLVSLVSLAFVPILIRFSESEISPGATTFNRFWLSSVILIAFYLAKQAYSKFIEKDKIDPEPSSSLSIYSPKLITLLLSAAVFLSATLILLAWSLERTTVANCEFIHNMVPTFTVLGEWLFLNRRFDRRFLTGLAIATFGLLTIGFNDLQIDMVRIQGDVLSLISTVALAAYFLLAERLRVNLSSNIILLVCFSVGAPITLAAPSLTHSELWPHSFQGWFFVTGMTVVGLIGQITLLYSFKRFTSGIVATVLLLGPIITAFWAWVLLSEPIGLLSFFAFSVVLVGLYFSLSSSTATSKSEN